jgi:PAS domain S-box-containing protein
VEHRDTERPLAWRYGVALVAVAAATAATWALQRAGLEHPPAPFLAAILLCGWHAGTGPAILAVVLSTFIFQFFFLPPLHSLTFQPQSSPYVVVFLLFAALAGWFSAARRRGTRLLEEARAELEARVAARTAELQRLNADLQAEIDERRRTEADLSERTVQLDELFEQAPEAIALLDEADAVLRVNREFTRLFGYAADEAVGRSIYELIVPDDRLEEARRLRARSHLKGERIEFETVRRTKDGARVPVLAVGTSIRVEGRQFAQYLIYRDITARQKLEGELRRTEAYLLAAQELSHTGSWARRVLTGEIYWSAETFRIYGLEPSESTMRSEVVAELVHPDDREYARETIAAGIRDKTGYEMDVRILRPDGSVRHVHSVGRPVLDENGELIEVMGVVMDVTHQKRAARALRRARERTLQARFTAVLDERTRLAREIHDTLLQGFTGISLKLLAATGRVTGPPEATSALRDLVALAQRTLEDARHAVWDMRSTPHAGGDFPIALKASAEERLQSTGLALEFGIEGSPRAVDPDVEAVCLRVAQEAIANVVKHAQAREVRVTLAYARRGVRLSVSDDGRGFEVDPDFRTYGGHWGLLGMRERAGQIRAKLSVRSRLGHGTEVVLLVPDTMRAERRPPSA